VAGSLDRTTHGRCHESGTAGNPRNRENEPLAQDHLCQIAGKKLPERGVIFADSSIFDVFTLPMQMGDPQTALAEPFTLVISQTIAKKYFGNNNPLGMTLHFQDGNQDYKVTGVIEDSSPLSHFQYDMIASLVSTRSSRDTSWGSHTYFTYLLLHPGKDPADLEDKFPEFVKRHWGAYQEADTGMSLDELMKDENYQYGHFLEPLLVIHLNPEVTDTLSIKGSPSSIYVFASIALIILLVACINFMNLSTARFAHRFKEVGVRKVLGSNRKQLIVQFLGESSLLAFLALGLSLLLLPLVLPAFSKLAQRELSLSILLEPTSLMLLLGIALLVGVLSGSYPAIFLSAFQPNWTPKGWTFRSGPQPFVSSTGPGCFPVRGDLCHIIRYAGDLISAKISSPQGPWIR